jgi:gluconolactonase
MRSCCLSLWVLSFVGMCAAGEAADLPAPRGESIVAPDARLELLFTRTAPIQGGLTEGPAVAPDGSIYFSDIPFGGDRGMILRFDPKTKTTSVFSDDSGKSNGLIFDRDGHLLACEGADFGGRCVSRWNVQTKQRTVVADRFDGKRFNAPNDLCVDRHGRIYFTDPRYVGGEARELKHRAVYMIDTDGTVSEATHEVAKPNGIAISPDSRTLYVADHDNGTDRIDPTQPAPPHGVMKIYAFSLEDQGRIQGDRRTFYDFGDQIGCDGMTVDARGNVYLTGRDPARPGVIVLNPESREIAFIPTGPADQKVSADQPPVGLPSNVEFGLGDELNVLYVTVDQSLFRIRLKVNGFHAQHAATKLQTSGCSRNTSVRQLLAACGTPDASVCRLAHVPGERPAALNPAGHHHNSHSSSMSSSESS